jgi:hypothetical protein
MLHYDLIVLSFLMSPIAPCLIVSLCMVSIDKIHAHAEMACTIFIVTDLLLTEGVAK